MRTSALKFRFAQAAGKARRFYKSTFTPRETARLVESRQGECNRCGRCCKILFHCPFLREENESYSCRIYGHHFAACKLFPIEPRDLLELGGECTYSFVNSKGTQPAPLGRAREQPRERLWQIS
ncbi:MAG: hypothetical protein V3U86_00340 [Acidobacteriota bacterium]